MTPEEPQFEISDTAVSRRRMLKRIGAGAAVAWSAPVLTSLRTPAFAQQSPPPCGPCEGDFCGGQSQCGDQPPFGCFCAQIVGSEPACFCYHDNLCSERTRCPTGQSDCPSGQTCVHTCCDDPTPVCFGPCGEPGAQGKVKAGARGGSR
jgi:hypothetical protein